MASKIKGGESLKNNLEGLDLEDREALIAEIESKGIECPDILSEYAEKIRALKSGLKGDRLKGETQKIMSHFFQTIELASTNQSENVRVEGEPETAAEVAEQAIEKIDEVVDNLEGLNSEEELAAGKAAVVAKEEITTTKDQVTEGAIDEATQEKAEERPAEDQRSLNYITYAIERNTEGFADLKIKYLQQVSELSDTLTGGKLNQALNKIFEACEKETEAQMEPKQIDAKNIDITKHAISDEAQEYPKIVEKYHKQVDNLIGIVDGKILKDGLREILGFCREEISAGGIAETPEESNEKASLLAKAAEELDQLSAELNADDYGENAEAAAELITAKIAEIEKLDQNLTISELNQKIAKINEGLDQQLTKLSKESPSEEMENKDREIDLENRRGEIKRIKDHLAGLGEDYNHFKVKYGALLDALNLKLSDEDFWRESDKIVHDFNAEVNEFDAQEEQGEPKVTGLDSARKDYFDAFNERGKRVGSKMRHLGVSSVKKKAQEDFEAIKEIYNEAKAHEIQDQLEKKKAEILDRGSIDPVELHRELAEFYVQLLQEEENKIDDLVSNMDRKLATEISDWWKKTGKKRLVLGVGMFVGVTALTGGLALPFGLALPVVGATVIPGVSLGAAGGGIAAGLMAARTPMATAGGFDIANTMIGKHTKWGGEKGLVDDMKNIGFQRKGNITGDDVSYWKEELQKEEYTTEQLGGLRNLSVEKGVGIKDAARFGTKQQALVEVIQQEYYRREKIKYQERLAIETKNENGLSEEELRAEQKEAFFEAEKQATDKLTKEQDKVRINTMKRHGAAAVLGIAMGALSLNRAVDAVKHVGNVNDVAQGATEAGGAESGEYENLWDKHLKYNTESASSVAEAGEATSEHDISPETQPSAIPPEQAGSADVAESGAQGATEVVVEKGDNVWNLTKHQLAQRFSGWSDFSEEQQTYFIDYFKDKIVADPSAFGIEGNVDNLTVSSKVNFGDLFNADNINQAAEQSSNLSPEQIANISDNNEAIATAAREGIQITTPNVDSVAAEVRQYGTDWIDKSGEIHDWAYNGDPVEVVDINGQEVLRLVDNPDTVIDELTKVVNHDGSFYGQTAEAATEIAPDNLAEFLAGQESYSAELLEQVANDPDRLNELINSIFEGDKATQLEFLHDFDAEQFSMDNNKAEVFLKTLERMPNVDLADINSIDNLEGYLGRFDALAESDVLPGKEWAPCLLEDAQGNEFYRLVHLTDKKFGQNLFTMSDTLGNTENLKEKALKLLLKIVTKNPQ